MFYGLIEEFKVGKWSSFYIKNCLEFSPEKRQKVLNELSRIITRMVKNNPYYNPLGFETNNRLKNFYKKEINDFIKSNFSEQVSKEFHKELTVEDVKNTYPYTVDESILMGIVREWASLSIKMKEESKIQANHKLQYLQFIYDCLKEYGLHPNIKLRPDSLSKYCVRIVGDGFTEIRLWCDKDEVESEITKNYLLGNPIITNGRLLSPNDIDRIEIFKSKHNKSELQLLALKNNLSWSPLKPLRNVTTLLGLMENTTNSFLNSSKIIEFQNEKNDKPSFTQDDLGNFDYNDLISLVSLIQERQTLNLSEDQFNDYLTDLLRAKGFSVSDQTRSGISEGQKQAGELDIVIRNEKGNVLAIIETFIIYSCGEKCQIARKHLNKLVNFYNANGVKNLFAIALYKGNDFSNFCNGYSNLLKNLSFVGRNNVIDKGLSNTLVIQSNIGNEDKKIELYSLLSNFK